MSAPFGTYNLTNAGPPMTWADIAREVFAARGADPAAVSGTTTAAYAAGRDMAPRPRHSTLSLDKITGTGFRPVAALEELQRVPVGAGPARRLDRPAVPDEGCS